MFKRIDFNHIFVILQRIKASTKLTPMKSIYLLASLLIFLSACSSEKTEKEIIKEEKTYASFGKKISEKDPLSAKQMLGIYDKLEAGDTVNAKFTGTIFSVCQKKGCWMEVDLDDDYAAHVTFKDYDFFVPLNASESVAIVNGRAFVTETTVLELKHIAEDEGLSQEEIDAITEPEYTLGFIADGVLIEE